MKRLVIAAMMLTATAAFAGDPAGGGTGKDEPTVSRPPIQQTFGPQSTAAQIHAASFNPMHPGTELTYQGGTTNMAITAGPVNFYVVSGVDIPAGAEVMGVWLDFTDNDATHNIGVEYADCPTPSGACTFYSGASSTGTPGSSSVFLTVSTPGVPVYNNNYTRAHQVRVFATGAPSSSGSLSFKDAIVVYKLRISDAPLTATFGDVPVGSGLHKFVEALYAAGITGGCAGGNFCPGDPLTRGQMAVFLATALGLHHAP
jgi:hypothetical protein